MNDNTIQADFSAVAGMLARPESQPAPAAATPDPHAIYAVKSWRTVGGEQIEEYTAPDGAALPAGVPRFLAFCMIVVEDITDSRKQVQVPFRFTISAACLTIQEAFGEYRARAPEESKKAYASWKEQQAQARLIRPGGGRPNPRW